LRSGQKRKMPVAIITGGNSGIGRATAVALARKGFDLGFTWHSEEERCAEAREEIASLGRRSAARQLDLHSVRDAPAAIKQLSDELGGIDVLVNNAGYGTSKPVLELTYDDWQGVLDVNLTGAFLAAQAAAKRMVEQGRGGVIVNVTSVHEHVPLSGSGPYTVSKHGLGGLTKVMALELGEHDIRVNSVAPGQIATRMTGQEDEVPDPVNAPLGRAGDAREVASLIAWLASGEATYVTGASYVIDGGLTLIAADHQ
jgi:NAD(P)-dependent dehydrogenase (short-subunit alcohol dehydrogenase family)